MELAEIPFCFFACTAFAAVLFLLSFIMIIVQAV